MRPSPGPPIQGPHIKGQHIQGPHTSIGSTLGPLAPRRPRTLSPSLPWDTWPLRLALRVKGLGFRVMV
eukprot:366432-Chlamydomonas_euryale.AAC.17